jgi:hypothetical protein
MHNNSGNGARKVFNAARHALRWLERGIYPVPLEARTKRPKGEVNGSAKGANGWTKLRVSEKNVHKHFKDGDNIGGLWGEPSNWAIDVDLDTPEAQQIALSYLPETLIYGRNRAPASHYIYRCKNSRTRKYLTKDIGVIAEIRSTGSQTVLPGSTHPSGDRYRLDHDVDIASIGWLDLQRRVGLIAAATIAAHYYPGEGGRHDYIHCLTGALLHAKWKDDAIRKFMAAVRKAAGPDEEKYDRDGTIENTIKKYKEGANIQGLPTLSSFMPELSFQNLRRYLGISEERTIPDNDPAPHAIYAEPVGEFPTKLLKVPGLVGRIAEWSANRSFVTQPIFDLAVGLMAVALATRNKYRINTLNTPLQPYFMIISPTATGKDEALDAIYYLANRIGLKDYVMKQSQSYHAMLDKLAMHPHILVWCWNECARYIRSAGHSVASQEYQVLTHTLSMYGKAGGVVPGIPARKNPIPAMENPFFLVMAAAQPDAILQAITGNDMAEGMINRFVVWDAVGPFPKDNQRRVDFLPAAVESGLMAFEKIKLPDGEFLDVGFADNETWEMLNDFRTYARESGSKEDKGAEVWGRAAQNAFILAGIVAVGIDRDHPKIDREIAQWAIEVSSWSVERWMQRILQSSSRTFIERDSKTVEKIIRNPLAFKWSIQGEEELELAKKGMCPKSLILRKCRHIKARDLAEILTHLMEAGLVGGSEEEGRDCYWARANPPIHRL